MAPFQALPCSLHGHRGSPYARPAFHWKNSLRRAGQSLRSPRSLQWVGQPARGDHTHAADPYACVEENKLRRQNLKHCVEIHDFQATNQSNFNFSLLEIKNFVLGIRWQWRRHSSQGCCIGSVATFSQPLGLQKKIKIDYLVFYTGNYTIQNAKKRIKVHQNAWNKTKMLSKLKFFNRSGEWFLRSASSKISFPRRWLWLITISWSRKNISSKILIPSNLNSSLSMYPSYFFSHQNFPKWFFKIY